MVIADMGSVRPGVPTLTIALRGMAVVIVEARTLAGPKHSGQFGGAAPDALLALLRALATLHDDKGDVAVPGLRREEWTGASYSDDEFRELAEVVPGVPLIGTGGLGERVWSGPALTVTGIDVLARRQGGERRRAVRPRQAQPAHPSRAGPGRGAGRADQVPRGAAAVRDRARGRGGGDRHGLRRRRRPARPTRPRAPPSPRPGAARRSIVATGGSIPLVSALQEAAPEAEILLFGTTDGFANIHAPNERVLLDEFEKAVAAEAEFFSRFAETFARGR